MAVHGIVKKDHCKHKFYELIITVHQNMCSNFTK